MLKVALSNSKFGLVIGTYGSVPYIHLFLESAKRNFPDVSIFVNDDNSKSEALRNICNDYGVTFHSNPHRHRHLPGDVTSAINGLNWAKKAELDILAKMSRRFIPFFDWTIELQKAFKSGISTWGNYDISQNLPLRTECFAMHINSWYAHLDKVEKIKRVKGNVFRWVEENFFNLANKVSNGRRFETWNSIGNNRKARMPNILWHHANPPEDYFNKAKGYELPYVLEDFRRVDA